MMMTGRNCPHTGLPCAHNCAHATTCYLRREATLKSARREATLKSARPEPTCDKVMEAVVDDLRRRSAVGLKKYGVPLSANAHLFTRDWLQHQYEELLDAANYCKCAIMKLDGEFPDDQ